MKNKLHFQTDVQGIRIVVNEEDLLLSMTVLTERQRRYAKCAALVCRNPREIRLIWIKDPENNGNWLKLRTYFDLYQITLKNENNITLQDMHVFAMTRFYWNDRSWIIYDVIIEELGYDIENNKKYNKLQNDYRIGDLVFERVAI